MRLIWILALGTCWLGTTFGGVVDWTQSKEDEALYLYKQYCAGGKDKGSNGGIHWYCKRPKYTAPPIEYHHKHTIPTKYERSKQIVFIETPSRTYKHHVRVNGEAEFNHDTNIYVVPGKDDHYVDIQADIRTKEGHEGKPRTLFLKNNPNNDDEYGSQPSPLPGYFPTRQPFYPPEEVDPNPYPVPVGSSYGSRRHRRRLHRKREQRQQTEPQPEEEIPLQQAESQILKNFSGFQDFTESQTP